MRAEVAVMSRNIIITGSDVYPPCLGDDDVEIECSYTEVDHAFGGHIQIKEGFGSAHIEGVLLEKMGQWNIGDRWAFPIYFDMAGDTQGKAFVKDNFIHKSNRRCVVLRATHSLQVENNVAYDHIGHCFHLMEGGEKNNVFKGNLVVGTRKLDSSPETFEKRESSAFFITNPLTDMIGNVAAGGDAKGYMYVFPPEPLGDSTALNLMEKDEAKRTPFKSFDYNVGHSYFYGAIDFQKALQQNGVQMNWNTGYNFKEDPRNVSSPDVPSVMNMCTFYKNRFENMIVRGGWFVFDRFSAGGSIQRSYLTNSIILGESDNLGLAEGYWNGTHRIPYHRSLPLSWNPGNGVRGVVFYDGPHYIQNTFFNNFPQREEYHTGAFGFVRGSRWFSSPLTAVSGADFGFDDGPSGGNRAFDGHEGIDHYQNRTGDTQAMFRDLDGSVTGHPNTQVVKPFPFLSTADCYFKENWLLTVCPHRYGKVSVWPRGTDHKRNTKPFMTRDDIPEAPFDQDWESSADFPVILGLDYSYILHFTEYIPDEIWLRGHAFEK
ncbi:transmembrane protein 2-like [Plakobranchus ocellatus]|uniref:Transmembrane protein 2-like n=1 Tax=Plakobranchus ocellatus TaxID=259542 RepID=A0AAV3YB09_9GAST|nr:transmembrane protein 2-like [Plakobranchus ocellatus]